MFMILSASKNPAAANVQDAAQYPIDFTELNVIFVDQSNDDGTSSVSSLLLLYNAFKLVEAIFDLVEWITVVLASKLNTNYCSFNSLSSQKVSYP